MVADPFAKVLADAKRPMIVLGAGAINRADGAAILALAARIAGDTGMIGPAGTHGEGGWNGFNILHIAASRVAALDLGFVPGQDGRDVAAIVDGAQKGEIDFIYLLGADEFDVAHLGRSFIVYQGQPRRCGRPSCRCRAARGRLHRERRYLCEFRRASSAWPPRGLSAGRSQGRLGNLEGAVRCALCASALRQSRTVAGGSGKDATHFSTIGQALSTRILRLPLGAVSERLEHWIAAIPLTSRPFPIITLPIR